MLKKYLIFIFIFICSIIRAQTISFQGKVIDAETGEGIPFATVQIKNKALGVVANSEGNFCLFLPKENSNDSLIISALGYELYSIKPKFNNTDNKINIILKPKVYSIDEIIVKVKNPVEIIKKAIENIPSNYPNKKYSLNGLYRELIKENDRYIKMAEAACSFKLESYVKLLDDTYAWKNWLDVSVSSTYRWEQGFVIAPAFDNFYTIPEDRVNVLACRTSKDYSKCPLEVHIVGGPLTMIAADKVKYNSFDLQHFFDDKWFNRHDFVLKDIVPFNNTRTYLIEFYPKKKNRTKNTFNELSYSGKLYIDTKNYAFVTIEYEVPFENPKETTVKRIDGFGKKPLVIKDRVLLKTYNAQINYFSYHGKWYLRSIHTYWPLSYAYTQTNKQYNFQVWRELFINDVITDSLKKCSSGSVFANTVNNSLYDYSFTYDKKFWDNYNMPPNTKLRDSIRKNLENKEKLNMQFSDRFNRNDTIAIPVAKQKNYTNTLWGDIRNDPYHWLEKPWEEQVKDYIDKENNYTKWQMQPLKGIQNKLYREIISRLPKEEYKSRIDTIINYIYYTKRKRGWKHENIYRKKIGAETKEELILDVNKLAEEYEYFSVDVFKPSPDNKYLAYSVDYTGNLMFKYYFKDLETEKYLNTTINNASYLFWGKNSKKVLFTNYNINGFTDKLYMQTLCDSSEAQLVIASDVPKYELAVHLSSDKEYYIIDESSQFTNRIYYLNAKLNNIKPQLLIAEKPDVGNSVDHINGKFMVISNDKAVNYKLYSINNEKDYKELVPGRNNTLLYAYQIRGNYLILNERKELKDYLRVLSLSDNKELYKIDFPEKVYRLLIDTKHSNSNKIRFTYNTFLSPEKTYELDLNSGKYKQIKEYSILGFDAKKYKFKLLYATSHDGTQIPVSFIYSKKNYKKNGGHPVVMYAYGAYGAAVEPFLREKDIGLLDRGIAIAYPHVRGGNDLGGNWWIQGRGINKKNTFLDFIACAKFLINNKYTSSNKLVGVGGSAGGLLMGTVANMAPELFNTIVINYPLLDMINNLNKSPVIEKEWGDIKNSKDDYLYIRSYSPYENIKQQDYPNMLFITSMTDERCFYWECAKTVAKLRKNNLSKNKILLLTKSDGGHGGYKSIYDSYREQSFVNAFILSNLGYSANLNK